MGFLIIKFSFIYLVLVILFFSCLGTYLRPVIYLRPSLFVAIHLEWVHMGSITKHL